MNKIGLLVKGAGQFLSKNSSKLLTAGAIGAGIATVIFAVTAVPKAQEKVAEELDKQNEEQVNKATEDTELERIEKLETKDLVKVTWKCFLPAGLMGCATIACIIGANVVHEQRQIALSSAYTMTAKAFEEYKQAVSEVLPEKKAREIESKVAENQIKSHSVEKANIYDTGFGDNLCYEPISGRYFRSDYDHLHRNENTLDARLVDEMYITYGDYASEIGLPPCDLDDILGYNVAKSRHLDFIYDSILTENGIPCLVVRPRILPDSNYKERYY